MGRTFRILSIDGGGIRGIYPAHVLRCIEERLQMSLFDTFDMIAGTSTGSIIAAGVANHVPAADIVEMYKEHGARIFRKKRSFSWSGRKLKSVLQPMLESVYDPQCLKGLLADVFQDKRLGDIEKPLLLPATDIGNGCVHVLKSGYSTEFTRDNQVLVKDAVLASCSAPIYFDPHKLDQYLLADGGLWANNPSLAAVIDAQKRLSANQEDIKILSIGTGHAKTMYGTNALRKWGFANGWKHKEFISFILSLQSQSAMNYLNLLLRPEQIKRIDFDSDLPLPLDDVSVADDLISRADHDFTHESEAIRQFILNGGGKIVSNFVGREDALRKAAQTLDISPSKYKQAMERYESMGTYLSEGKYDGATDQPEIYLQGAFKLGTEIRPYKNCKDADYDIDIVCRLEHPKESITPEVVKHQVGDHLKAHGTYKKMLDDEGKRCWTLNYAEQDGIGFHMDILPSVQESWDALKGYSWCCSAIAVTNKCCDTGAYDWSSSNPKDFAGWFFDKNKTAFENVRLDQKQAIFETYREEGLFSDRDAVPDIHVKTPLQRAIQLLKRHRDIRFSRQRNERYKPISMIITVLAAHVYRNEPTIYETLSNLIDALSRQAIQMQPTFRFDEAMAQSAYSLITRNEDGTWYIANPTNHGENFADKWHEDNHARAKAFFQWVAWAREDFVNIAERLDEEHYTRSLIFQVNTSKSLSLAHPTMLKFNVPHRQKPIWSLSLNYYSAQISARFKAFSSWQRFNSGDPLGKNCDLLFSAKTDVPEPFRVYWQVVNTGREAENARQLRGEIFPSKTAGAGGLKQKEYTSYAGIHWVECFIVKNDVCLARSGEFVVRIE